MHIFTSAYTIQTKDGTIFQPQERYVVPSGMARTLEAGIIEQQGADANYRLSHFNSYERRYHGQQLFQGDTLDIYRHGAIGDTLMTTAVVAELRRRNPFAEINIFTRPGNVDLWYGLNANVVPGFPWFDEIRDHHHLFYENMLECNSEPDQECAVDSMLRFAGIDPESVPDERKLPVVVEREDDYFAGPPIGKFIFIQDGASNGNRSYPHTQALREQLFALGFQVLVFGEKFKTPRFRNLIPIIKAASLVICPDSSIGHLAAAFPHVPVISLWGLFDPSDRVKYYKNHLAIHISSACPHSPCRSHEFILPHRRCKDAIGFGGKSCAALSAITPELVVQVAKSVLSDGLFAAKSAWENKAFQAVCHV